MRGIIFRILMVILCQKDACYALLCLMVSITKFFIVIGSPCAYLSRNRHTVT